MDANTRHRVRERAMDRCEYCGLPQSAIPLSTFHVEHIRARQHDGSDDSSNLALSCDHWKTPERAKGADERDTRESEARGQEGAYDVTPRKIMF